MPTIAEELLASQQQVLALHYPSPQVQAQQRGIPGQVAAGLGQAALGIAEMPFRALSAVPGVRTVTEPVAEYFQQAAPVQGPGVLEAGIRTSGVSLGAMGMAAAATAIPGVGPAAIPALVGGLFGLSQVAETRNRLEKLNTFLPADQQLSPAQIYIAGLGAGTIEGVGESIPSFLLQRRFFPGTAAAMQEARNYVVNKLLPAGANKLLQMGARGGEEYVRSLGRELPTEIAQNMGETAVERAMLGPERLAALTQANAPGIPPTPGEAAAQTVGPVAVASALTPAALHVASRIIPRRPMAASGAEPESAAMPQAPGGTPATGRADMLATNLLARMSRSDLLPDERQQAMQALKELLRTAEPGDFSQNVQQRIQQSSNPRYEDPLVARHRTLPFVTPPQVTAVGMNPLTGEGIEGIPATRMPGGAGININPLTGEQIPQEPVAPLPFTITPSMQTALTGEQIPQEPVAPLPFTITPSMQTEKNGSVPVTIFPERRRDVFTVARNPSEVFITTPSPGQGLPPAEPTQEPTPPVTPPPPGTPPQAPQPTPAPEAPVIEPAPPVTTATPRGPGEPQPTPPRANEALGNINRVITPVNALARDLGQRDIETRFAIVDAATLIHSMDRRYPPELQPRLERQPGKIDVATEATVARIANNPDFLSLAESRQAGEGAPIIDPRGYSISGTARIEGLKRMYGAGGEVAQRYRGEVLGNAQRLGLDPTAAEQMRQPVLVRVLTTPMTQEQLVQFADEANQPTPQAPGAVSTAVMDAKKITAETLRLMVPHSETGIVDMNSAANRPFREALTSQLMSPSDVGRFFVNDQLTQDGANRLRRAIFARAYGNSPALERLMQDQDEARKSIAQGLLIASPAVARLQESIDAGDAFDRSFSPALVQAANKMVALHHMGQTVPQWLREQEGQPALFDETLTPVAKDLIAILDRPTFKRSAKKVAELIHTYVESVYAAGIPGGLFITQENPPNVGELFLAAAQEVEAGHGTTTQTTLFPRGPSEGQGNTGGLAAISPAAGSTGLPSTSTAIQALPTTVSGFPGAEAPPAVPGQDASEQQLGDWIPYGTAGYAYREVGLGKWEVRNPQGEVLEGVRPSSEVGARNRITRLGKEQQGLEQIRQAGRPPAPPTEAEYQQLMHRVYLAESRTEALTQQYQQLLDSGVSPDDPRLSGLLRQIDEATEQQRQMRTEEREALRRLHGGSGQLSVLDANRRAGLGPVTLRDVQRLFHGQAVTPLPDGTFRVAMPVQGATIEVVNVAHITPTQAEIELSTGQSALSPTQQVVGRATQIGQSLFRIEVTPGRTTATLYHEGIHTFEDMGLLTEQDIATLNRTLQRQGQEPTAENRADLLAARLNANTRDIIASPLMRVLQKIQQFFDRLARLAGIRTTGQLVRVVQSGALFQREGTARINLDALPPIAPGMVRLYRGESVGTERGPQPEWLRSQPAFQQMVEASGRWWTDRKELAEWYKAHAEHNGLEGHVVYQDVPEVIAHQAQLVNQPAEIQRYTRSLEGDTTLQREYFLPAEYRGQGQPVPETPGHLQRQDTEESQRLTNAARQQFGVTNNPREAGYLLPEGQFLDFSGGEQGQRTIDHDAIGQVFQQPEMAALAPEAGTRSAAAFIRDAGAVRWAMPTRDTLMMEIAQPLTEAQHAQTMQAIRQEGVSEVLVDRVDPQTGRLTSAQHFALPMDRGALGRTLRPEGRLQVIETDQQALPGLEPETPSLASQATARQVPPATPRQGATYATELKSLLEYAAVTNAMSPNQIAYLQQRNDEGHAFFQKPYIPIRMTNATARAIQEEWRQDPNKRALFLQRLAGPESATMPRAATTAQTQALFGESQDLWQLMYKGLQADVLTPQDFADFEAWWEASNGMIHYAVNAASEFGRGLRMQREDATGLSIYHKKHQELNDLLRSGKLSQAQVDAWKTQLQEAFAAQDITTLQNLQVTPPTLGNYWWELYYSWLYNVQTWSTNLWSTAGYQIFHQGLVEPLAAGIDRVTSRIGQREQQIYGDVVLRTFTENLRGLPTAMQHSWWLWRRDPRAEAIPMFHRQDTAMRRDIAQSVGAWERAVDSEGNPIPWMRAAAPWVTATSRALEAYDVGLRENGFNARMRGLAEHASQQELGRLDETWMQEWQQTQVRDQTAVFQQTLEYSKELTFHGDISAVGNLILQGRKAPYGLGFLWRTLFPFAQTPDNLLRRGLELLPGPTVAAWYFKPSTLKWAGWLPHPGREAFTPEASVMFAKQMIGTMMAMGLYWAWSQGKITGPAPQDPDEREAMYRRGEMPNSVRVGDTWTSWRRFEPVSLPMSVMVSVFEAWNRLEARQKRRDEVPTSTIQDGMALATVAAQAMITNVLDSSYFAGAAQFLETTQRGRETGDVPKGILRQLATMITPWSSIQRAAIRAVDSLGVVPGTVPGQTMVRQPEGLAETLATINLASVYSEAGPPIRRDLFGRPQFRVTSPLGEFVPGVPPIERNFATDDPVEAAFKSLRYFPGGMAKTDELGKAIPRELHQEMMQRRGELLYPRLQALVDNPNWDRLDPTQQRKAMQQEVSRAGARAKREVLSMTTVAR